MKYGVFKSFINLIYPLKCQICQRKLEPKNIWHICKDCWQRIRINLPPFCKKCGRSIKFSQLKQQICKDCRTNNFYFDSVWAVCRYEGVIKECLHLFKYNKKVRLLKLLSELMHNFISHFIDMNEIDVITAVPLHKSKLREREFNQSHLLANIIAKKYNKQDLSYNLNKTKSTDPQVNLKRLQRLSNLKDAFMVKKPTLFKGKNILLIDDVLTTGSTINECSKSLKEAGSNKVYALALARGN